ncbi:VC0807 family protein [Uliginosibacterium aquaticum]|uniref:Transmembrane protein n=1 Tax=Uliginosibacterium aquaticum TaxID=2731212 RepID=A0ABX2IQ25_9RHOO|nr:VC0807 family protein [Uliginosibacterium aquaticum]NSL56799.1 hypothetical protein [Uliginosibacterium aquaticum]
MKVRLHTFLELLLNLLAPWLAYSAAEPHYGEFGALIASSLPPLAWSVFELLRYRRVDALSFFILGGIALSLLAMALGGDARLLLVRESLISGLFGIAFLVSLLFQRPLVYYLACAMAKRGDEQHGAGRFHAWWQLAGSRKLICEISFVWGTGLALEAALRIWLAWHWEPQRFLAIAPPLGYAIAGLMGAWTFWRVRRHLSGPPEATKTSATAE